MDKTILITGATSGEAQGMAGRITTLNVSTVARRCLNLALSG